MHRAPHQPRWVFATAGNEVQLVLAVCMPNKHNKVTKCIAKSYLSYKGVTPANGLMQGPKSRRGAHKHSAERGTLDRKMRGLEAAWQHYESRLSKESTTVPHKSAPPPVTSKKPPPKDATLLPLQAAGRTAVRMLTCLDNVGTCKAALPTSSLNSPV